MDTIVQRVLEHKFGQKGWCAWCGLHLNDEDRLELDHIIPTSLGGKYGYIN